jgi:Na+-driven multidrug efflux pump
MIPIVAYNYGARHKKRITHTIKLAAMIAIIIMLLGLIIFQCGSSFLLTSLFDASENMLEIGVPALRIISLSFLFAGYNVIISSSFQALGNGIYSLIISVVRQLIVILPVAYAFSKLFGLSAVWWSFPIAEVAAVIICTILLIRIYRQKVANLEN